MKKPLTTLNIIALKQFIKDLDINKPEWTNRGTLYHVNKKIIFSTGRLTKAGVIKLAAIQLAERLTKRPENTLNHGFDIKIGNRNTLPIYKHRFNIGVNPLLISENHNHE